MKIKLGFSDYNLVNKRPDEDDAIPFDGITIEETKTIWSLDGEDVSKCYKEQVMFHELTHAMLQDLGYNGLSEDENFVDGLGKEIHTLITKNNIEKLLSYAER